MQGSQACRSDLLSRETEGGAPKEIGCVALPAEFLARAMGRLLGQTLRLGSGITEGYFVAHPTRARPDEKRHPFVTDEVPLALSR